MKVLLYARDKRSSKVAAPPAARVHSCLAASTGPRRVHSRLTYESRMSCRSSLSLSGGWRSLFASLGYAESLFSWGYSFLSFFHWGVDLFILQFLDCWNFFKTRFSDRLLGENMLFIPDSWMCFRSPGAFGWAGGTPSHNLTVVEKKSSS